MSYTDTFSRTGDACRLERVEDGGRTVAVNTVIVDGESYLDAKDRLTAAMAQAWAEPVPVPGKDQPERPASRRA